MRAALGVELLKLRRAPVARVAGAVLAVLLPLVGAGMVWAAWHGGDSPMALKVRPMLIGTGWDAYLGVLGELMSVGGFLAIGFVLSWTVGREFTDRTVGALLAQPTPPGRILLAKLVVVTGWALTVGVAGVVVALPAGLALGLGMPGPAALTQVGRLLVILLLTVLLALPLAWVSTRLRGYLSGIATLIGLLVLTQLVTVAGAGAWFPFAAPSLWSGMGGAEAAAAVTPVQLALAVPVGLLGALAATLAWQRRELV